MWLLASDLHLTDNKADAYRLPIFRWLVQEAKRCEATAIIFLGDMTDRKDNHSGWLLNFIADEIKNISDELPNIEIYILQGNHDYTDPLNSSLRVLNNIYSARWISKVDVLDIQGLEGRQHPALFVPFQRYQKDFEKDIEWAKDHAYDFAFFHQTFTGAAASSGITMEGIPVSSIIELKEAKVFAGDIHVPQTLGQIEYIGAPYQINFGDHYTGRCILFDPFTATSTALYFPCLRKHTIDVTPETIKEQLHICNAGDQIKVRLHLTRADLDSWVKIKREVEAFCQQTEVDLRGIEIKEVVTKTRVRLADSKESAVTEDILSQFCKENKIDEAAEKTARTFLE